MINDIDIDSIVDMERIRNSVMQMKPVRTSAGIIEPTTLIDQGDRMIGFFDGWLLDDEQHQAMAAAPKAKLILYTAAYLCDIGLLDPKLVQCQPSSPAISIPEAVTDALNIHSAGMIRGNWQRLGIQDESMADLIAEICLRAGSDYEEDIAGPNINPSGIHISQYDLELISACLKMAKALDLASVSTLARIFTRQRGSKNVEHDISASKFHVKHAGSHPYLNGTIRIQILCHAPDTHRALKHHERRAQQMLEMFNQSVRPRFLYSDVIYEIDPVGYEPIDLKFSVDSSAGLHLFMGNRLYTDKRVFLRELIQNAVDACNYRTFIDADYDPAITIKYNDDISSISIRDNGIGMSREWIEKYFLAIGISFYQSDEIRNANRDSSIDFGFISQFGIGFLSSFQVAEKIVIKTRKASSSGLSITISSLKDYFDVRVVDEDFPVGTEVTLHLKASEINYCRRLEFAGYLKTNIRFLNIPVTLVENGKTKLIIGRETLAYSTDKRYSTMFVSELTLPESEGYLRLGAKDNGTNIFSLDSASGGVSIFQDGIFVTQLDDLLPEGARNYVVSRINLMGQDKCELSMDRNRIFWTPDQLKDLKRVIRYSLVEVSNQLMAVLQESKVSTNTLNSIVNHLAIFFDFSDVDDYMYQELNLPVRNVVEKRFRDFVRINFAHTLKTSRISAADGYNETWQQQVLDSFTKNASTN